MLFALSLVVLTAAQDPDAAAARAGLGEELFFDERLSSSKGDMATGCASCHMATDPRGDRAFTEDLSRSWRPWRRGDTGRDTLRNTPTLLDLEHARYLHLDGEFSSLEELSRETLVGRNFGWLPGEREEAIEHFRAVIRGDGGERSYTHQFDRAYGLDVQSLPAEELLQAMAKAMADFMTTLESKRDSPYDGFLAANNVDPQPRPGESPEDYGRRVLEDLARLRGEQKVTYVEGFGPAALTGYEVFLRSSGIGGIGNCVVCHVPPYFTDGSFHNTGVTQDEYDGLHGEGSFAALDIPERDALSRPVDRFRSIPSRSEPGHTDLGYWNFARIESSPLHRAGEAEAAFFDRTVARFKTPTLRHLASTGPYNHTGRYGTLELALEQKLRASELARLGKLRNADPELVDIRISARDIEGLVAFLDTLNERNAPDLGAQAGSPEGQWREYASDKGSTKYSPLDQIDRSNVRELEIAWIWETVDAPLFAENRRIRSTSFQGTPIMVDGVLYVSTSLSQVVAIDPSTGVTRWVHDPRSWENGRPPNWGFVHRGVAFWADGSDRRVFIATGDARLIALDADTGVPVDGFGDGGAVDLKTGVRNITSSTQIGNTSPPTIVGDIVVVASGISDGPRIPDWPDGKVKGIDARSGELLWTFNLIPQENEFGVETWNDESWRTVGSTNAWSILSADEDLGYVYVPVGTPTNDWYGGHRTGQTLFAESLICLDAATGERVWHYQFVHHGLWDYDLPAAPTLVDITVDGRPIKAVAQVSKQGFCYVLDRVTGEPVWPIEERPVPTSGVEGEESWPTQPFPTKPPPFERQGVTVDDLIDFTPELRAEAIEILANYDHGPLFTPPSERGSVQLPGSSGGANWQGAAFDPDTQMIYIPSITCPIFVEINRPDPNRSTFTFVGRRGPLGGPRGLPLTRPPYGRITAIDLNRGEIVWQVANGPGVASLQEHPDLAGIDLSRVGHVGRAGPLLTKTLLFLGDGTAMTNSAGRDGGGKQFRAYDKATGDVLWEIELPGEQTGTPMTYLHGGEQYIVLGFGGQDAVAGLVALRLPAK